MYVQADRPLYLRRRTFDRFENDRWSASDTRLRKILPQEGEFNLPGPDKGDRARYTVQIVSAKIDTLPLSAHARQVVAPASVIGLSHDGNVHLPGPMEPGFGYAATSILPVDTDRPIAHDVPADPAPYLQLPEDFSPRIAGLAQQVTERATTALDRAVALESHLRSAYAYSFETVFTSQNLTPLDAFLFETRRGHCEFFASALAVMLRSLGIPSRVVHGYLAHSFNPVTGFFEVRAFDGHAWVEAHIDGRGWMTFEPTAAYPAPQRKPQTGTALFDLKTYTEQLAQQEALQGKWSLKSSIAVAMRQAVESWHALVLKLRIGLENLADWLSAHAPVLAATVFLSGALAVAGYVFRVNLFLLWAQLTLRLTPAPKVPLAAFRLLERLARTRQLGKKAGETADEYIDRLLIGYVAQENELNLLRRAFNVTRYGAVNWTQTNDVAQAFSIIGAALKARVVRAGGAA
jgi:transglutaminase-like putative cysteine protease